MNNNKSLKTEEVSSAQSDEGDLARENTVITGPWSPPKTDPTSTTVTAAPLDPETAPAEAKATISKVLPDLDLDPMGFPDAPGGSRRAPPSTLDNFVHVIDAYGIVIRFNRMKKEPEVTIPGLNASDENRASVSQTVIESLLIKHGMVSINAQRYILAMADSRRYDPFADWVDSKPWDGTNRLPEICKTVVPAESYPGAFANVLVIKWLLSIVAATYYGAGFHCRGILTFQGAQGLGKTSWFARLVTPLKLRNDAVKLGHSWDGGSKDAKIGAISHRIVEWGELESSLRRELPGLKAFSTDRSDKIRVPYARVASEYPRTTVFGASVNASEFLIDPSGNSRFWTIAAEGLDYTHDIDMQQVFAELKVMFQDKAIWWLTPEEEAKLASINANYEVTSVIADKIAADLDLSIKDHAGLPRLRATEVLQAIGIERPTNMQLKEANVALRSLLGPSRRIKGLNCWYVPWLKKDPAKAWQKPEEEEY